MGKPGDDVRKDPRYQKLPAADRAYWEAGANASLTAAERDKLCKEAEDAGKYDPTSKQAGLDYPQLKDIPFFVDDGALTRNVKEYVRAKLSPQRDIPGTPAPSRPLGGTITGGGTPAAPKPPADNPTNNPAQPGWVCHDLAEYMAALMRCLGYPVREVNVKLIDNGWDHYKSYQEAAIQVWFNGKWHFVDPYHCCFDPAVILDSYSSYKQWKLFVWEGHTPPTSWAPVPNDGTPGEWHTLPKDESGNDLQKRFYSLAPSSPADLLDGMRSDGLRDEHVYSVEHAETAISGVWITSDTPGVSLYLADPQGRIADGVRAEIPGATRIAAGSVSPFIKELPSTPIEIPTAKVPFDEVFFGTRSLLARYDEIGTHHLVLRVIGPAGQNVALRWRTTAGYHPVVVEGLPPLIAVTNAPTVVPFTATIGPIDSALHLMFETALGRGDCCCCRCCHRLLAEDYVPTEDRFLFLESLRR